MTDLDIQLDLDPDKTSIDRLSAGLNQHSSAFVEQSGFDPIALFAYEGAELRGGIYGLINWNWLSVSLLWVDEGTRGSGLGTELLERLESEAVARGCVYSHVDTFSFQAEDFYRRHGYEPFAELADYPPGHRRIYFRKTLGLV